MQPIRLSHDLTQKRLRSIWRSFTPHPPEHMLHCTGSTCNWFVVRPFLFISDELQKIRKETADKPTRQMQLFARRLIARESLSDARGTRSLAEPRCRQTKRPSDWASVWFLNFRMNEWKSTRGNPRPRRSWTRLAQIAFKLNAIARPADRSIRYLPSNPVPVRYVLGEIPAVWVMQVRKLHAACETWDLKWLQVPRRSGNWRHRKWRSMYARNRADQLSCLPRKNERPQMWFSRN